MKHKYLSVDQRGIRLSFLYTLLIGLICLPMLYFSTLPTVLAQEDERCFPETGYCISGRIRSFWEQNGGLPVFGYPIASQQEEMIEGKPFQVQWFERNRLELHPENEPPYDVLLGRLSDDLLKQQGRIWQDFAKSDPADNCLYFEQTGHNVCGDILEMWRSNGIEVDGIPGISDADSLALFGLPLSGEQVETLSDNNQYTVQWFERARFELHPENEPPYHVLLGLLGNETSASVATEDPDRLAQIEIGELQTYSHSSGVFSMLVPNNWEQEEQSGDNLLTVIFTDPTVNGAIVVTIFSVPDQIPDLGSILNQGIQTGFGNENNLQIGDPQVQSDGSVQIIFTYTTIVDDVQATMIGKSFIRQDGGLVSITWSIIPKSQDSLIGGELNKIRQSYEVNEAVPLP